MYFFCTFPSFGAYLRPDSLPLFSSRPLPPFLLPIPGVWQTPLRVKLTACTVRNQPLPTDHPIITQGSPKDSD